MLARTMVLVHPDVVGELSMGCDPEATLGREAVQELPAVLPVGRDAVLDFVIERRMNCNGIGWVDAGLIAACTQGARPIGLYTGDRPMARVARSVGVLVIDAPTGP
jgi:hypothetical protein